MGIVVENKDFYPTSNIRNFCIISHVDHGKTTLSDHLLVTGGMLPESLAGKLRALDYLEIEQNRGITIEDSIASFTVEANQEKVLVNLIDTPGHVDFSSRVSDALTLVDNGLIIVDAVEGVMAQTITVIRQALRENLDLTLFINKIDRLITELQYNFEQLRSRIEMIIGEIHTIIKEFTPKYQPPNFNNGRVIIGSALDGWGVDIQNAKQVNGMRGIIEWYQIGQNIPKEAKLSYVFHRFIVEKMHPPKSINQLFSKPYWNSRELNEKVATILKERGVDNEPILLIGKSFRHKFGIASLVRVLNGTITKNQKLYSNRLKQDVELLEMEKYRGKRRIRMESTSSGDIIGVVFSENLPIGDLLTNTNYELELPKTTYFHEPVIAMTVEPKEYEKYEELVSELKLIEKLHSNLRFEQSTETGELLISGLGQLHLEIVIEEIQKQGFEIYTSRPEILTYMIPVKFGTFKLEDGNISYQVQSNDESEVKLKIYSDSKNNSIGIKIANKLDISGVVDAFRQWLDFGYIKEKVRDLHLFLNVDSLVEELSYEETLILTNKILKDIMNKNILSRHKPMFEVSIRIDENYVGNVVQVINRSKGEIIEIKTEMGKSKIEANIPIHTNDIVDLLRRETEGRIFWNIKKTIYEKE